MSALESAYQTAVAAHRVGRLEEAESIYRQVLQSAPSFARALHLLGVLLYQQGDTHEALTFVEQAIEMEPHRPVFHVNIGAMYRSLNRFHEAERAYRRSLGLTPNCAKSNAMLGLVLTDQNRCEESIAYFRRSMELNPVDVQPVSGLAYALSELGYLEESINEYQRAYELSGNPNFRVLAAIQLPLVYESHDDVLRWREKLERNLDQLLAEQVSIELGDNNMAMPMFNLAHQGFNNIDIQRKMTRLFHLPSTAQKFEERGGERGGKIRVGFISNFFCFHTIGKLARGLITQLSHDDFHVTLLSVGSHSDSIADEFAAAADHHVVLSQELAAARRTILECDLDVLFYTDIGMHSMTYSLAYSRLAPIQCLTWGHPDTTGLDTMDYFVSSDLMEVPEAQEHYSEKLVRLPSLTFCYRRSELPAKLKDRAAFGLHPTARLYACPQSIYKFHPDFDIAMAEILRRDPEGQVVLIKWAYEHADDLLRKRFAATMPDVADRIVFINRLQQPDFMNFLNLIDVALDPFPFGGGNSSLEAFSFGVPVVTLPTQFLKGRITQALCRRLEIEECIASDVNEYVEIAL